MKKAKQDQAVVLRAARKRLNVTTAELAGLLGKSVPALMSWIAPEGAARRRTMPVGARMLLERILKDAKKK